jgi:hypothetical protein
MLRADLPGFTARKSLGNNIQGHYVKQPGNDSTGTTTGQETISLYLVLGRPGATASAGVLEGEGCCCSKRGCGCGRPCQATGMGSSCTCSTTVKQT